jgi:hypothetical protein
VRLRINVLPMILSKSCPGECFDLHRRMS